jgi:membrane protein implicated in regulation of membrane protease activity
MDAYSLSIAMLIIGGILIALEPIVPGFFISVVGTFLAVMGAIGLVNQNVLYSPISVVVATVVSILAAISVLYLYKKIGGNQEPQTLTSSSLVGKKGIVRKKVIPHSIEGKVEIENTMWSATADHEIPEGTLVKVVSSEGVHVVVTEINKGGVKSA